MKTISKLLIISLNLLFIDTLQRHDPTSEYAHDYQLRKSKPQTTEDEKY